MLLCETVIVIFKKYVIKENLFILKNVNKMYTNYMSIFLIGKNNNNKYPKMYIHRLKHKRSKLSIFSRLY